MNTEKNTTTMKATYTPDRDDTNPAYLFSSTPTVLLVAAASGAISLKGLAMNELANRGLDQHCHQRSRALRSLLMCVGSCVGKQ